MEFNCKMQELAKVSTFIGRLAKYGQKQHGSQLMQLNPEKTPHTFTIKQRLEESINNKVLAFKDHMYHYKAKD